MYSYMYIYIYIHTYIYMCVCVCVCVCIYIYIYIYIYIQRERGRRYRYRSGQVVEQLEAEFQAGVPTREWRSAQPPPTKRRLGLYKICFYFEAFVHDSTILAFPAPTCIAHPGVIPFHDYWSVYDTPSDLPCVCHTPCNIGDNNIVQRPSGGTVPLAPHRSAPHAQINHLDHIQRDRQIDRQSQIYLSIYPHRSALHTQVNHLVPIYRDRQIDRRRQIYLSIYIYIFIYLNVYI